MYLDCRVLQPSGALSSSRPKSPVAGGPQGRGRGEEEGRELKAAARGPREETGREDGREGRRGSSLTPALASILKKIWNCLT